MFSEEFINGAFFMGGIWTGVAVGVVCVLIGIILKE